MKLRNRNTVALMTFATLITVLAACAAPMTKPMGANAARNKLTQLQSDPRLASQAPDALRAAEVAVRAAEQPQRDPVLANHLVLMADRKVEIARSQAQTHWLEAQRLSLNEQRETARLDSRTREADRAHDRADTAQTDARQARLETDQARSETNLANTEAQRQRSLAAAASFENDRAKERTREMQQQIAELNAKTTDRGLVVTLGDVLFDSGQSSFRGSNAGNLGKLSTFLTEYRDRTVIIEGHTDSTGSEAANMSLSQRRADTVKTYLTEHGVSTARISAFGRGESMPVADNTSASGRQQNRRVEIIITDSVVAR